MKDIHDVITHGKFGDDRLRGLGVVAGQISAFPIDFAGRPYNTLALPCERVILSHSCQTHYLEIYQTDLLPISRVCRPELVFDPSVDIVIFVGFIRRKT